MKAEPQRRRSVTKDSPVDLSRYRIIDFATHGLVPGELNDLTQPALALTAPAVAGVPGDGLLTMEKILALKLDADWVVLSACTNDSQFAFTRRFGPPEITKVGSALATRVGLRASRSR